MEDFPQELVDEVIDRLFDILEKDNRWQGFSRRFCPRRHGISDYLLVSRAWVDPTQKHHFNLLHLGSSSTTNKWWTRIAPDPAGVSRHVRKLVLDDLGPSDFEGFEAHMRALTQVESLTVMDCKDVSLYVTMEWFLPMKSSLVELQVCELSATPLTITSLLAALPLLNCVQIYEFGESDDETTSPISKSWKVCYNLAAPRDRTASSTGACNGLHELITSYMPFSTTRILKIVIIQYSTFHDLLMPPTARIPFFEGANRLMLCSSDDQSHPKGSFDWIPPFARFSRLDINTECVLYNPDLVNQWFASSRETLTNLTIRWEGPALIPQKPTSLDLPPCTSLEFLKIPIWPFAEMILPNLTSSQLAKVILYWSGRAGQGTARVDNNTWKAIEEYLCPIAKAYNHAYPERKVVLEILIGPVGEHHKRRVEVPRILNDEKFMSQLKEEVEVVVR
ncbi:hypothetical protein BDM02DRAFT_3270767 [Thelephora ganbajun]|uniref:Uncharacterized protein n=1 Tax=Thelephora ganbajun TaxID=370292 RepID=A0ACB6ZBH8_THEGA|nr:hypothetical protein BDM02DRAFT_3270767 [Thelephora ganbajun]